MSTNVFLSNSKGFPVLSEAHKSIVCEYMKVQARIILQPRHIEDVLTKHVTYLTYVFANHDPTFDDEKYQEFSNRNYL